MKNNTKLIIGIALPVLVILFVIIAALLPSLFFHPKNDFLYTVNNCIDSYSCNYYPYPYNSGTWIPYKVTNGQIVKETNLPVIPNNLQNQNTAPVNIANVYPKIYRYSVSTNTFNEISLEDAQKLSLTDGGSAPDGTVVVNGGYGDAGLIGDVLGGGRDYYGLYLKNGSMTKGITVQNAGSGSYYNSNFHLIGWIK